MKRVLAAISASAAVSLLVPLPASGVDRFTFDRCHLQGSCRLLSKAELDRLRGGFTVMGAAGPINMTFGISQVVYINNQLVATTQLVLPDLVQALNSGDLIAARIKAMRDSLDRASFVTAAGSARGSAVSAPAASVANGQSQSTAADSGNAPTAASPQVPSVPLPPTQNVNAAAGSTVPVLTVNGVPVAPGSVVTASPGNGLVIQNGPGNVSVIPTAEQLQSATRAVIIQNTLSNQTIAATTRLNVSLSLTPAINAANIQQMVRQAMSNSLR